jgi:glycine cleavage system H protein
MYPADLKYTVDHEWVRVEEGNRARMGITHFAQKELGDVVFVELPEKGTAAKQGENCAAVESVKAVADVYAPVSGEVVEVNEALADRPELVNEDPYGEGWIAVIAMSDAAELGALLDAGAYKQHIGDD